MTVISLEGIRCTHPTLIVTLVKWTVSMHSATVYGYHRCLPSNALFSSDQQPSPQCIQLKRPICLQTKIDLVVLKFLASQLQAFQKKDSRSHFSKAKGSCSYIYSFVVCGQLAVKSQQSRPRWQCMCKHLAVLKLNKKGTDCWVELSWNGYCVCMDRRHKMYKKCSSIIVWGETWPSISVSFVYGNPSRDVKFHSWLKKYREEKNPLG